MSPLRRQLPAFSPLPLSAAWRAARQALRLAPDPRPRLAARLRDHYGRDNAVLFGSGTEALEFALLAARRLVGGSTVVALPAYSCFDVAAAAVAVGATIRLYDLDPDTMGPDWTSLGRQLVAGARVVVVAPLYGVPVDWDAVTELVAPFGAVAVEDAAQGHGADWRGRPLGGLGVLGVLSFGRGKGWTGGRGGALLFPGPVAAAGEGGEWSHLEPGTARETAVSLTALAQALLSRPALYGLPASLPWLRLGETWYRAAPPPDAMTRTAAALLEATWAVSRREAEARRVNARALLERLDSPNGTRPIAPPQGGTPGYLRLPIRVPRGLGGLVDRGRALRLGAAPGYPATLAELGPARARLVNRHDRWHGAATLVRELVTLPTHSLVTPADREALARLLGGARSASRRAVPSPQGA